MRAAAFLPLLLGACACDGAPRAIPSAEAAALEEDAGVAIRNFRKVDDGLYRGAQPNARGYRALAELGVKTIVNLRRFHRTDRRDVPEGIDVVDLPMRALVDSDPPSDDEVRRFFDVVLDPARRPVFVHCAHGKDRTGTMCALYRIEVDGWTPEAAFAEMKELGFHRLYADLRRFVNRYSSRGFGTR